MSQPASFHHFSSKQSSTHCDAKRSRPGTLKRSLYGRPSAELWVLGSSYQDLDWPDNGGSMEIANGQDIKRVTNWASRIRGIVSCEEGRTTEEFMRKVLRGCGKAHPTILYLGGHTIKAGSEGAYLPDDCYDTERMALIREVSFRDIHQLLLSRGRAKPLLFLTDACGFTNVLKLPFVLRVNNGCGYWEKTEYYIEGIPGAGRDVLHYAASEPTGSSYGFNSAGAIFTRAFCNVPPDEEMTLVERSPMIQGEIDSFMWEHSQMNGRLYVQRHQVYSSKEFSLQNKRPLQQFGFVCDPFDGL